MNNRFFYLLSAAALALSAYLFYQASELAEKSYGFAGVAAAAVFIYFYQKAIKHSENTPQPNYMGDTDDDEIEYISDKPTTYVIYHLDNYGSQTTTNCIAMELYKYDGVLCVNAIKSHGGEWGMPLKSIEKILITPSRQIIPKNKIKKFVKQNFNSTT